MSLLRTFLFVNVCILSISTNSEELDESFFKDFQKNYCINNEYNCKFDGSVSGYSIDDFLGQKYKFVELFFAENNFESAIFENCGSRAFNPSVTIDHKQNSSLQKGGYGCIRFKYIKDRNIESMIEEKKGLFYSPDRSIYSYSTVMPGYVITLVHPNNYYKSTGSGYNNLGVHFFIDLMDKKNLSNYCSNKTLNNIKQLPSSLRKLVDNDNINESIESLKKDYYIFYRLYLKDIANFVPSKYSNLLTECGFIKKSASNTRKIYLFNGKNFENKIINNGEKI